MKLNSIFLIPILFCLFENDVCSQDRNIYRKNNLQKFIQACKTDSILYIERMSAIKFHALLNNYRKQNGLDTVNWDDIFWLACRNHCIYMFYNRDLGHLENKTKPYFTGKNPGDRLLFVQDGDSQYWWCGENALVNSAIYGNSIDEIAENIALASFNQWRSSPGHNANMLSKDAGIHGVAFIISSFFVYGTSFFGYSIMNHIPYLISKTSDQPEIKSDGKTTSANKVKAESLTVNKESVNTLNLNNVRKSLEKMFEQKIAEINNSHLKNDKNLSLSARKHAEYMAVNQELGHSQKLFSEKFYGKTPAKRIARAEGKTFWFLSFKTSYQEYVQMIELNTEDFEIRKAVDKLYHEMVEQNQLDVNVVSTYGFAVKIKKQSKKFRIWAVLIC